MRTWITLPVFLLVLAVTACGAEPRVRPSAIAGTWYPGEAAALRKQVDGFMAAAPKVELGGPPVAIIAPHAGYQFSGKCAGAVYAVLVGRDIRRVIVMGPSHRVGFRGASIADVDFYETPLGKVPLDRAACDELLKSPLVQSIAAADREEHSVEIQLPFLQAALKEFKLVPIVVGELRGEDYPKLAAALRRHVDAHTLVVASSDFTHYGRAFDFAPFEKDVRDNVQKLDKGAIERILKLDGAGFRTYVSDTGATICGHAPIAVLLEMLSPDCRGILRDYYQSGDAEKDYTRSVSYAGIAFAVGPGEVSAAGQKVLLDIARKTLQAAVNGQDLPKFDVKDPELQVQRGMFVTYKNRGELRGCIGRFASDQPLWKLVQEVAVDSARRDSRFADNPITAKEEPSIHIEISILSPMVRAKDPLNFIPGVHGIYVRRGAAAGTYLPQVATEQGWDRETFISHLCRYKTGIAADAWKDKETEVYIYSAQVFGEKEGEKEGEK